MKNLLIVILAIYACFSATQWRKDIIKETTKSEFTTQENREYSEERKYKQLCNPQYVDCDCLARALTVMSWSEYEKLQDMVRLHNFSKYCDRHKYDSMCIKAIDAASQCDITNYRKEQEKIEKEQEEIKIKKKRGLRQWCLNNPTKNQFFCSHLIAYPPERKPKINREFSEK